MRGQRERTPEQLAALAEQVRQAGKILGSENLLDAADELLERVVGDPHQLAVSYATLARILDSDESYLRKLGRAGCWPEIKRGPHWVRVDLADVRSYLRRHTTVPKRSRRAVELGLVRETA